ncbi:unnamed protein product [Dovyalis caffra]|uniref:non-specific serine/threonine protein kinase n=1 Tax=Dovyalis caffra TaxID=77055 RepID=A0AAV1SL67_9ROSI|nr:unnamed protein product [Dovyalis caffra]
MSKIILLVHLSSFLVAHLFISGVISTTFTITNKCTTQYGRPFIQKNQLYPRLVVPMKRMSDCCSGKLECSGNGGAGPLTLAEFGIGSVNGLDFFDVSVSDGFNLPLLAVPSELKVTTGTEGKTVGCMSACQVTGLSMLCCVLSTTFTITNKCNYTVWPAIYSEKSALSTTGFSLEKNESKIITAPAPWSGSIWGRTYCTEDSSGNFSCITGDCGSGKLECSAYGSPPVTVAQFTTGDFVYLDIFDFSLVNGFNLPLLVVPSAHNCTSTGCFADLNESCPSELQVTSATEGKTVGCKPSLNSRFFKDSCPQANIFSYHGKASLFTCASTNYQVTFCPVNTTVMTPNNSRPTSGEITPSPPPEIRPNTASKRRWVPIIAGLVGGVLAIISFVVIIVWRVGRSRSEDTEEDLEDDQIKQVPGMPVAFSYEELCVATDDFKEILGRGGFGSVFKGKIQGSSLDWQTRKKIILHIAKGLAYLHEECRQTIMHLDIKPQNMLLDPNFNAKISDFGLSKLIDREMSQIQLSMRGTPGYIAPEWHQALGRITVKVDIYSFGIVLLEVVCARRCVDHSQPESAFHLLRMLQNKAECIMKYLVEYKQSDREEIIRMINIAAWCLQDDPERRPLMSTVVKLLEGGMEVDSNLVYKFSHALAPPPVVDDHISSTPSPASVLSHPR